MESNSLPLPVKNYLKKYGLAHRGGLPGRELEISKEELFNNIVVIPAIQEYENIRQLLDSLHENDSRYFQETLFVFVINNTVNAGEEVKNDNARSIEFIRQIISGKAADEFSARIINSKIKLGLVDASSEGRELSVKDGGVGLARKIGMDAALNYFDYSNGKKKILICLDADCTVENDYLSAIVSSFNARQMSAAYVRYEHRLPETEKEQLAIICYEIFLRYYTLGLKYAGSPFAFPTIGSTMICDADSYIKIGGMNKKKAAEDFYFMEKLAKVTKINAIDFTKVYPSSRASWRVPFGTGQRVNRFFAGTHDEYMLYNPDSFKILGQWLDVFNSEKTLSVSEYLENAKSINTGLHEFLLCNSFDKGWANILSGSKSSAQIQKQKTVWFDGFRTLKLIHYLRDFSIPRVEMFDALDEIFAMMNYETGIKRGDAIPSLPLQMKYLNHLRKLT